MKGKNSPGRLLDYQSHIAETIERIQHYVNEMDELMPCVPSLASNQPISEV